ncbi:uncharacterized protein [Elaeis guineensis]|uniref:uncharacterized protein isoform X4 n=1 Tax=Elaeis guineensis var. tenera TaxID=51953 RepID=UPI003C6DA4D7
MEMDPENIEAVIHQRYGVPEGENSGPSLRFPPGFNFNPNDQELIRLYLDRKIKGEPLLYNVFKDVNLYDYDPEELVGNYELSGEEKFYFFTSRTRKYPNGSRPARAAGGGYWKATGSEKKIYNDDDELVGVKKTLVYYRGKAKENDGVKTDWIMQEYISEITTCKPGDSMKLDDWVLCCIHKKRGAIDNPHKLQNVSQAQSDMPTEQDAKNNQSYQTFIDSNGGYDNAIMVQRLVAAPGNYELSREEKFYFFTSRTRKYPNGSRPACTAGGGYWKAKGSEKKNYSDDELVGVKKTLVYYRGKAKKNGVKTDWTMQEYISEITTCKPGDSMKNIGAKVCCTIPYAGTKLDFQELRITIQKRQEDAAASLNNLWMEDAPENSDGSEKEITWRKHNPSHWVAQWKLIFLWRVLL